MPHDIIFAPKDEILSYEEMIFILEVLHENGIRKVRITGGEPLARKDLMYFLRQVSSIGFDEITLTSNGVMIGEYLEELKELGIIRINLSLDTLDKEKFHRITLRDDFEKVKSAMHKMLDLGFIVKMNAVVMKGINDDEIASLSQLSLKYPIAIRFIEAMPFDGKSKEKNEKFIDYKIILNEVKKSLPEIKKIKDSESSTSLNYQVEGAPGTVGVIPAFTRNFCSSCNRIRLTSFGELKTCLYESGGISIRDYIRKNPNDKEGLWNLIVHAIKGKYKDGFAAEADNKREGNKNSMSTIGG